MHYDLEWLYDIFILEAWHLVSIIFSVFFLTYIWLNTKKTALFYSYAALQLILLNWLVCKVFKTIAPTAELKWLFIVAQYCGVCFLGSALLMFGRLYAKGKPLSFKKSLLVNIPLFFFLAVIATNERHHLFYSTYDFRGDTFGPVFYAYSALTYVYIAAGIYYCAVKFKERHQRIKAESWLLLLGILVPLAVNALYVSGLMEPRFDITPVSYNISLALFVYAIYNHQFLDVIHRGTSIAVHNLPEGVLLFTDAGKILEINGSLLKILAPQGDFKEGGFNGDAVAPPDSIAAVDRLLGAIYPQKQLLAAMLSELEKAGYAHQKRELVSEGPGKKYLSVELMPLKPFIKKPRSFVAVFYDNTAYIEMLQELRRKNSALALANSRLESYAQDLERLAIAEERNRLAREIHDILGHSLVLLLNILESSLLLLNRDPAEAKAWLNKALASAKEAQAELNSAFKEGPKQKEKATKLLAEELRQLAGKFSLSGMRINLEFSSKKEKISSELYHTIFRVCQEGLTNALKHGGASEVNIFLRINLNEVDAFVLDNGLGCKTLIKGRGLTGMEERIKKMRGTFACGSPEESGFIVHARLPCQPSL